MIRVDGLSKTFKVHEKEPGLLGSVRSLFRRKHVLKHAVKDVRLSIDEGEIVGLIGANGAGKTTLIKMLAGIIYPTSGEAQVLGYRPWERDDRFRRQIALIMGQKAQLWWDLPAADCFLLLKEIYRLPDAQYQETLDYLTEVLGVRDQLKIQIRRLSLGERMKMELLAALLHSPRVVFLDEPTIGLDLTAQRAIREFILQYREQHRPAMLVTSHYMEDIQRLCERIVIIRQGELIYDGSLEQVMQQFATHKRITAHLRAGQPVPTLSPELLALGEVQKQDAEQLQLEVPRADVPAASAKLLQELPVADLAIDELDIGTVIERILDQRAEIAAPEVAE
ncbi:MAG: ATP-binding cassette domain-containing protein [Planctomycetota bacterium]